MKYDVIIVGAGSAGCVLAARLSEDMHRTVLLLEAGPGYPAVASLPPEILNGHRPAFTHDWGYFAEPGQLGRSIHLARARIVGGCSATNATFALRGAPTDYDEWAARGNPGWSFDEVLPYFRRLERDMDRDDTWHGQDGPLPIRRYPAAERTAVQQAFLNTCHRAGYPCIDDHNAPGAIGAGPLPVNTIDGVRQSTALTYLAEARGRPNLTIRSEVLVDHILFDGNRARGVRLAIPAESVWADRIILCAGAYSSPAVLMRSGIGPGDHLKALGIKALADLPGVGQGLQDHPLLGLPFRTEMSAIHESVPMFQTMLTLKSAQAMAGDFQGSDLQIFPMSAIPAEDDGHQGSASFILFVSLVKPRSSGQLRLRSAAPDAPPVVDLAYFSDPADLPRMVEGVRAARQLSRSGPLSQLIRQERFPGPQVSDSAEDLQAIVWQAVETYHHPVGTCRMGPSGDPYAVVDARGRVYGVENLAVVDASIMPAIPSANTNLPTIMLAERCAAWLAEGL